jgi:hypothetical protein
MVRPWALASLALLLAAGCLSSTPDPGPEPDPPAPQPVAERLGDGRFAVDVDTPVVLIGWPDEAAEELRAGLDAERVEHASITYPLVDVPPDSDDPDLSPLLTGDPSTPAPVVPTAAYRVVRDPRLDAQFAANLTAVEGRVLDGTAAEAWLAENLPRFGVAMDANRTVLVLPAIEGGHSWRYHGNLGWLQPVRTFGERHPMIAIDLTADADPYVSGGADYRQPLTPDRLAKPALKAIADVTHHRLLQGPIYPQTVLPCHAVTLILAVRATALTDVLPGFTDAEAAVAADRMASHFQNLTRMPVHVDLKVLRLPVDDPVLDALSRERVELSAIRLWLEQNWEAYWVEHAGCEPYVSFALYGDLTDAEALFAGIAMHDVGDGHRISYSIVGELTRLNAEGPHAVPQPGRDRNEWFNRLYSHETGHLFGQRHPHDITKVSGGGGNNAFSSVWSTMSYQVRGVVDDFGHADQANFARNRAGYVLQEAVAQGLDGTPEFQAAMEHLAHMRWQAAADAVQPLLKAGA